MHNRIGYNRLNRNASHRRALRKNMVTSLFKHERITTTKSKAKEIRRTAEKMITRAKEDTVHNRRIVAKMITDKAILAKLFTEIGPANKSRPGGYTRILHLGQRGGDAAEMVLLELVEKSGAEKEEKAPAKAKKKVSAKSAKAVKTEKPAKAEEKAEKAEVEKSDKSE